LSLCGRCTYATSTQVLVTGPAPIVGAGVDVTPIDDVIAAYKESHVTELKMSGAYVTVLGLESRSEFPVSVEKSGGGSNAGAVAGGVIGSLLGVAAIAGGIWFYAEHRKKHTPSANKFSAVGGEFQSVSVSSPMSTPSTSSTHLPSEPPALARRPSNPQKEPPSRSPLKLPPRPKPPTKPSGHKSSPSLPSRPRRPNSSSKKSPLPPRPSHKRGSSGPVLPPKPPACPPKPRHP
jgi:hypothetical protein